MGGTLQYELSIVMIEQGRAWTAQCLEYDLAAQGGSIQEAQRNFESLFIGQVLLDIRQGRLPLHNIGKAPKQFFDIFSRARTRRPRHSFKMPSEVPAPFIIRAAGKNVRVAAAV